jgi:hypothetical protein
VPEQHHDEETQPMKASYATGPAPPTVHAYLLGR